MNLKKIFFYFLTLVFLTIATHAYNITYSDLTIDPTSWCANLEATIKVYNETDFQNLNSIKDNLCRSDESPQNDSCEIIHDIASAKVTIHNGPLSGLAILKETTTDANGEFKVTFTEQNQYLIKIEPTGRYNEYETIFTVENCKGLTNTQNTTTKTTPIKLYNLTYNDDTTKTFVKLENTPINSTEKIIVSQITNLELRGLPKLNYNITKTIEIKSLAENSTFSKLTLDTQLTKRDNTLKLFYYNPTSKTWETQTNFVDYGNKILIENAKLGIYSITGNEIKVEQPIIQETKVNETQTLTNENTQIDPNQIFQTQKTQTTNSNTSSYILLITISIVFAAIGIGTWQHIAHNKKQKENEITTTPELDTYKQVYEKATQYIKQYKNQYTRDQLYRALKSANVPQDIIDKILAQEY